MNGNALVYLGNWSFECKIQKNWCTVTVAPTIEHHGGHSRTPANQRWDQVPGRSQRLLLGLAAPAMNARDTTKMYIWNLDTECGPTLYRKCHSHSTPGKRHNNTWVEPLAGNCTTSSTRQREQVWQKCHVWRTTCAFTLYGLKTKLNGAQKVVFLLFKWLPE